MSKFHGTVSVQILPRTSPPSDAEPITDQQLFDAILAVLKRYEVSSVSVTVFPPIEYAADPAPMHDGF
jgi:hypothetical protein